MGASASLGNRKTTTFSADRLIFWMQRLEDSRQAVLAKMGVAMNVLAMPASSETLFSSAKLLISDTRNRLEDDVIEASELDQSRAGFWCGLLGCK
jgi:hypothetical protein